MKALRYLPAILFVCTSLILLLDVYGSNTRVYRYLHIYSYDIAAIVLLFIAGLRIFIQLWLPSWLTKVTTFFILPFTLLLASILIIWSAYSPPNYVFSLTHLQSSQILLISFFSFVIVLLFQPNKWFADHIYSIIFAGMFAFLGYISLASLLPFDIFAVLSQEDGVIETAQVIVLALGAVYAFLVAKRLLQKKVIGTAFVFLLLFGGLLFVAGDEISWGQRIFDLTTPTTLAKYNTQDEITLHNLSFVHSLVGIGYIFIGIYGFAAWYMLKLFPRFVFRNSRYYVPHWACSPYFYAGFLYNLFTFSHTEHQIGNWSESAELLLYSGLLFTIFIIWRTSKTSS